MEDKHALSNVSFHIYTGKIFTPVLFYRWHEHHLSVFLKKGVINLKFVYTPLEMRSKKRFIIIAHYETSS